MPGVYPTLSFGSGFKYPAKRKIIHRSGVHTFADLSQLTYRKGVPLVEFEFEYSRISTINKNALRAFYIAQGGEFATDWTLPFDGVTYTNCQFVGRFECVNVTTKLWDVKVKVRALQKTPPAIASAILSVWTEYISLGGPTPGFAATLYSIDGGATMSGDGLVSTVPYPGGNYVRQLATFALPDIDAQNMVSFTTYNFPGGTLFADGVDDEFRIYDTWLDVTFVDATTARWTGSASVVGSAVGGVIDPSYATDTDSTPPVSYAAIYRTHFSGIASPPSLVIAYG